MKKVLIVDDVMVSLLMTENILASEYETVTASSGEEAIEVFHKEHPDLVLSDLRMPGISGFELQRVLQDEVQETIPFMFMTADQAEETESTGFENGAMDFIRKPFRADVLLRRVRNIIQNVSQIQDLRKTASTDPLTGLLNKASSQMEIDECCKKNVGALLMIDLDSFKLVNDLYGHGMGDKLLVGFSKIIRNSLRSTDIVGRIGGDEFVAYCIDLKEEMVVANMSYEINTRLVKYAKEIMGEDMSIPLGASIGCAFAPEDGESYSELYNNADKALYSVKQGGKHGYKLYSGTARQKKEGLSGLSTISMIFGERNKEQKALLLNSEGFRVIYQFMGRRVSDDSRPACVVLLTVQKERGCGLTGDEAIAQFVGILRESLRSSDVVTQSGDNQFILLLSGIEQSFVPSVIQRIKENLRRSELEGKLSITCEYDQLH